MINQNQIKLKMKLQTLSNQISIYEKNNSLYIYYETLAISLDDLIQSIFDNLNILQTSLLFLKLGILHPFIIDHEEIINNIKNKTNYEISNSNIESVIDMSKTYAIGNVNESLIHIFLSLIMILI